MIWELKRDCDSVRPCDTQPGVLLAALPRDQPSPRGASFNGLVIAPSAAERVEQSQEKSPGTRRGHMETFTPILLHPSRGMSRYWRRGPNSKTMDCPGNISAHEYPGANPSQELLPLKAEISAPAAGPQPPARLERQPGDSMV